MFHGVLGLSLDVDYIYSLIRHFPSPEPVIPLDVVAAPDWAKRSVPALGSSLWVPGCRGRQPLIYIQDRVISAGESDRIKVTVQSDFSYASEKFH